MSDFKVVVGSWHAYNEDTELAYGSEWLDFAEFASYEEIEKELEKEGFDVNGKDSELFIQDIDFDFGDIDCDGTTPKELFKILTDTYSMKSETEYHKALAYMEVDSYNDLKRRVLKNGENWDEGIEFWDGATKDDWAYNVIEEMFPKDYEYIFKNINSYIDYDRYFDDSNATETDWGVIELY